MTLPHVLATFFFVPGIIACCGGTAINVWEACKAPAYRRQDHILGASMLWFSAGALTFFWGLFMGWWGPT